MKRDFYDAVSRHDEPLRMCTTSDGALLISIGLDTLIDALNMKLRQQTPAMEIRDRDIFARAFIADLMDEGDQEECRIGLYFDSVAERVAHNGEGSVDELIEF